MASSIRIARNGSCKPSTRRAVVCHAHSVDRRALGALLLPAVLFAPRSALALIPDEEDEDLLEKAKANRKARIAQNKEVTRQLLQDDGIVNKQLSADLMPVQKAVYQLAQVGLELEEGDLNGAASAFSGSWVNDFEKTANAISAASAASVVADVKKLKDVISSKADLKTCKKTYVAVAGDFKAWATEAKIAASLNGL